MACVYQLLAKFCKVKTRKDSFFIMESQLKADIDFSNENKVIRRMPVIVSNLDNNHLNENVTKTETCFFDIRNDTVISFEPIYDNTDLVISKNIENVLLDSKSDAISTIKAIPRTDSFVGKNNFKLYFEPFEESNLKKKKYYYNKQENKIYVSRNKKIKVTFTIVDNLPLENGSLIRCVLVYGDNDYIEEPVIACKRHSPPSEAYNTNNDLIISKHVVRSDHKGTTYIKHPMTKRLSMTHTIGKNTTLCQIEYYFWCLSSCLKKPTVLIFTLENALGDVLGRQTCHLKVSSCPNRDMKIELRKNESISNNSDGIYAPYYVPVYSLDFFYQVNQFAEYLELGRRKHLSNYEYIDKKKKRDFIISEMFKSRDNFINGTVDEK